MTRDDPRPETNLKAEDLRPLATWPALAALLIAVGALALAGWRLHLALTNRPTVPAPIAEADAPAMAKTAAAPPGTAAGAARPSAQGSPGPLQPGAPGRYNPGSPTEVTRYKPAERPIAAAFSLPDLRDGRPFASSSLRGRAAILNFFASWCPPCRGEMPGLASIHRRYRDRGVAVVGICMDTRSTIDNAYKLVKDGDVPYPVLIANPELVAAYGGIRFIPTTFVVARDGRIAARIDGYVSESELEHHLANALDDSPEATRAPSGPDGGPR